MNNNLRLILLLRRDIKVDFGLDFLYHTSIHIHDKIIWKKAVHIFCIASTSQGNSPAFKIIIDV
jgi:hypothetical protein